MIRVENIVLGMCATNCYAVFDGGVRTPGGFADDGILKDAVIVDPAAEPGRIEGMILRLGLRPVAVVLTHGHFDHIMAADAIRKRYGIKIYANRAEREIMTDSNKNLSVPFTGEGMSLDADVYFNAGDELELAGMCFKTIAVPGHTIGGTCYYLEKDGILISGDTLFEASVGRSDFPTGNAAQLIRSIKDELMCLPEDVRVFPGHGVSTTIGNERVNNPFLV